MEVREESHQMQVSRLDASQCDGAYFDIEPPSDDLTGRPSVSTFLLHAPGPVDRAEG